MDSPEIFLDSLYIFPTQQIGQMAFYVLKTPITLPIQYRRCLPQHALITVNTSYTTTRGCEEYLTLRNILPMPTMIFVKLKYMVRIIIVTFCLLSNEKEMKGKIKLKDTYFDRTL